MALNPTSRGGQVDVRRMRVHDTAPSEVIVGNPPAGTERRVRPPLERTEPNRAAAGLFRQEAPAPCATSPATAAQEAVSAAYQVFDRYLEEGRRFAEGQSAWYRDDASQPDVGRDAIRAFAELLGILGRMAQQMGLPGLSNLPTAAPPFARPFHPQQDPRYQAAPPGGQWLAADLSGAGTTPAEPTSGTTSAPAPTAGVGGSPPPPFERAPEADRPRGGTVPGAVAPVVDTPSEWGARPTAPGARPPGSPRPPVGSPRPGSTPPIRDYLRSLAQERPTAAETSRWGGAITRPGEPD